MTLNTYYPNITSWSDFRILSVFDCNADVGKKGGLFFTLGLSNEYDSVVVGPNNDLKYYFRINYEI